MTSAPILPEKSSIELNTLTIDHSWVHGSLALQSLSADSLVLASPAVSSHAGQPNSTDVSWHTVQAPRRTYT